MSRELRRVVRGAPIRLDRFVQAWLGERLGRRRIAAMVAAGVVRVNARRAPKGRMLRDGDTVTLEAEPRAVILTPTPVALTIVHADESLVAIDKAPGMPSLGGAITPSVASALLAAYPEMALIDPARGAGLAHRLDTATSGLLIAARTRDVHRRLRDELGAKRVEKEYLAIVAGALRAAGRVDQSLRRRHGTRARMEPAGADTGWRAVTEYAPLAVGVDATLVRLRMRTGVTHQLRAHMAAIGHPVLGDARYGRPRDAHDVGFAGHCLHARRVAFDAPDLPPLATAFPAHWEAVCRAQGWRWEDLRSSPP